MANLIKKQDEFISDQGLAKKFNINSNKVFNLFKAFISFFISLSTKNLFMKSMKTFMKLT